MSYVTTIMYDFFMTMRRV